MGHEKVSILGSELSILLYTVKKLVPGKEKVSILEKVSSLERCPHSDVVKEEVQTIVSRMYICMYCEVYRCGLGNMT